MKNLFKARVAPVLGIVALVAIIGFSMTACPEDGGGGPVSFGDELNLSGQVYTVSYPDYFTPSYAKFEGNLTLTGTGTGKIEGGQLTYTAGVPTGLTSITSVVGGLASLGFSDPTVSDDTAKAASLEIDITSSYYDLTKENSTAKISDTSISGSSEEVMFIYVDKDVTITATGGNVTDYIDGIGIDVTIKNLKLSLKAGWNAIDIYQKYSVGVDGGTGTLSVSVGNPDLKWVLD